MSRNPDLDKLLREVNSLTGNQSEREEPPEVVPIPPETPPGARKESSFLKSIGGFFISKVEEDEPQTFDQPTPTPNTIIEVASSEPAPDFSGSMSNANDLSNLDFAQIYQEAGIDESNFTIDKLAALLDDPTLKDQPLSTKTLVLKMALKAQNVTPESRNLRRAPSARRTKVGAISRSASRRRAESGQRQ